MSKEILTGHALEKKIKAKKEILEFARIELKKHFVGIDGIIDQLIDYSEVWYSTPEILSRPLIVCLWGPTGVGKTDLIRRFVKLIDFADKYCEIELANKNTTSWHKSISSLLADKNVPSGSPSVIMLDEIQGFRTLDEDGHDIPDYDLKDIWTLLSDGRLPYSVDMDSLMSMLWRYNKVKKDDTPTDGEAPPIQARGRRGKVRTRKKKKKDSPSYYELSYFKSLLRLEDPIEDIALWDDTDKRDKILERMNDKSIFEEEDFSQSLIFISGNIDEAYGFTRNAKEVDLDADLLHEISKRINILDIKGALGERFRPEQISRMGNNHIIYPTLSGDSFKEIISRKSEATTKVVKEVTGVEVSIAPSIEKLVYENGVYPTQGTRPVFSTFSEIVECNLPKIVVSALIQEETEATIKYENDQIVGKAGDKELIKDFVGTLDKIRKKRDADINRKTISAVHEVGHAIIYANYFGVTPTQIVSTPVSDDMEGFVYFKDMELMSKEFLLKKICALLGGRAAEELVFGHDGRTAGNTSDLEKATNVASLIVRKTALGVKFSAAIAPDDKDGFNNEIDGSNQEIDDIIKQQSEKANETLKQYQHLLVDVVDVLLEKDRIDPETFKDLCAKHGMEVKVSKANDEPKYWDSNDRYQSFKTDSMVKHLASN
tara:strand:- start:17374 stop:19347 length:1974 start_codon:yes stop_codon:yes gene_type:complete